LGVPTSGSMTTLAVEFPINADATVAGVAVGLADR
jgi:hypothetical protein